MYESRTRPPLARHGLSSFLALMLIGGVFVYVTSNATHSPSERVVIETVTSSSASLSVAVSRGTASGMIQLTAKGSAPLWAALPSSWTLKEVQKGELSQVRSRAASGATAWRFPSGVTATFWMPTEPTHLSIRHRSPFPLQVTIRSIDMIEHKIDTDVRLLSGSMIVVW
jgi:hypothetical protein